MVVDEAARVSDELYYAIRPMLAVSKGRLIALSTPWGKRGWYFHEYTEGGSDWQRVRVPADQCQRITPEFLAQERASMPLEWWRQEYLCEFTDMGMSLLSYEQIMKCVTDKVESFIKRS